MAVGVEYSVSFTLSTHRYSSRYNQIKRFCILPSSVAIIPGKESLKNSSLRTGMKSSITLYYTTIQYLLILSLDISSHFNQLYILVNIVNLLCFTFYIIICNTCIYLAQLSTFISKDFLMI